jgi:hypothetical protein
MGRTPWRRLAVAGLLGILVLRGVVALEIPNVVKAGVLQMKTYARRIAVTST